jgi:hypothetical protein
MPPPRLASDDAFMIAAAAAMLSPLSMPPLSPMIFFARYFAQFRRRLLILPLTPAD